MFLQYVFTEGETAVHIQPHGDSKRSSSHKEYKRTMSSNMEAIQEEKGEPREIMHAIIDDRRGIDNVRSSEEYLRDQGQIYHTRSKSNNRSDDSYQSTIWLSFCRNQNPNNVETKSTGLSEMLTFPTNRRCF